MTMAKYETPPPVRPLEKLITDFSCTNGLDPVNVLKGGETMRVKVQSV